MKKSKQAEEYQHWIAEICPQAINSMRDLLSDPTTPVSAKVQLIGMILDRTLGKAETPLRVTTTNETLEEAEEKLAELVKEMTGETSLRRGDPSPAAQDGRTGTSEKGEKDGG